MIRTATRWLPFSVVGALVALVAGMAVITGALASPATVAIGSATVAPGDDATVSLSVTPASGESVGALTVDIAYDTAVLTAKTCQNKAIGSAVCNTAFADGKIRYTIAATDALTGALADVTFGTSAAGSSALTLTLTTCANIEGGDISGCTVTNGTITVAAPTPTPSPSPTTAPSATAAATATPTPKSLPQTGGAPTDGSSSSMEWLVGSLGLAVLAAGVWAVSRTRRQSL